MNARAPRLTEIGRPADPVSFSLVVPCYNVGPYIDDFLQSIAHQTIGLGSVQVILVDDGSTDETAEKARSWSGRHSGRIEYVRQENRGLSEARNTGLRRALGEWVSFPDPDDFLAPDYLEKVKANIDRFGAGNTAMVACKFIQFYEATGATTDDHVLTYRFASGVAAQRIGEMSFIQLQVATAFFQRQKIHVWGLWFDPRIKPGFEDAHFANRYLARCTGDQLAVFAADAVYTYRKRSTGDSLLDTASTVPEFWTSQPRYGWLDLLQDTKRHLGYVPPFVARTIIYNLKGHLRILLDGSRSERVAPDLQRAFEETLDEVIPLLGGEAIRQGAPAFRHRLQLGLLNRYSLGPMRHRVAYVIAWRPEERLAKIEWFAPSAAVEFLAVIDGKSAPWVEPQVHEHPLLGSNFYHSHTAWVHVSGRLTVLDLDGKAVRLRGYKEAKNARSTSAEELDLWARSSQADADITPAIPAAPSITQDASQQ